MFCAYTRPRYQVSVYRTIGPLVYMYIAPGQGQTALEGQYFSLTVLLSQYSPLLQDYLH